MIRALTAREKQIFMAALAVVIFSLLYNGLMAPLQAKNDLLDERIAERQKALERDLKFIRKAEILDARYDAYLKQFAQSGAEEGAASEILSRIESVAGRFGLRVMDLKPQRIKHNEYDSQFSVSLTINSELLEIVRFLYTVQQEPYWFEVEEVSFEKLMREGGAVTTRIVLGKAFILAESGGEKVGRKTARRYE